MKSLIFTTLLLLQAAYQFSDPSYLGKAKTINRKQDVMTEILYRRQVKKIVDPAFTY